MEPRVEFLLAENEALERSDVLKVPHHGSRTSTGDAMLELVRPAFAVISAGYANPYNHPHPQLLERLKQWRAVPLRTDQLGLVSVFTNGARLEVSSQAPLALR
jgi:competence protein ComEC